MLRLAPFTPKLAVASIVFVAIPLLGVPVLMYASRTWGASPLIVFFALLLAPAFATTGALVGYRDASRVRPQANLISDLFGRRLWPRRDGGLWRWSTQLSIIMFSPFYGWIFPADGSYSETFRLLYLGWWWVWAALVGLVLPRFLSPDSGDLRGG